MVVVEDEENHEVSYDEVRHDPKTRKPLQHSFRKQDLCEISETHVIKRLHMVGRRYDPVSYTHLTLPTIYSV